MKGNDTAGILRRTIRLSETKDWPLPTTWERLRRKMTPDYILAAKNFPSPKLISPNHLCCFEDVWAMRHQIRRLQVLPIKTEAERERYHQVPVAQLLNEVLQYLDGESLCVAPNAYPYWMSTDVQQNIVWMVNEVEGVAEFIARVLHKTGIPLDQAIVFERPTQVEIPMVRGSFRHLRHIHLWTKVKSVPTRQGL